MNKFDELYESKMFELQLDEELQRLDEIYVEFSKENILKMFGKAGLIIAASVFAALGTLKIQDRLEKFNSAYDKGVNRAKALGYDAPDNNKLKRELKEIFVKK